MRNSMIVFITTNHKEKLDAALVRSSRIDYDKEIGPLDAEATGAMFAAFYGASSGGIIESYLRSREFVPRVGADLQLIFMTESDPRDAVARMARHEHPSLHVVENR